MKLTPEQLLNMGQDVQATSSPSPIPTEMNPDDIRAQLLESGMDVNHDGVIEPEEEKAEGEEDPGSVLSWLKDGMGSFKDSAIDSAPSLGAMAGGIVGLGLPGVGPIGGAGIGGAGGAMIKNAYNRQMNPAQAPQSSLEYLTDPVLEGGMGALGEMSGQGLGFAASDAAKAIGRTAPAQAAGKVVGQLSNYVASKMAPIVDNMLIKGAKILGNIPEEFTAEYLQRKGKLNPRSAEEIMTAIDEIRNGYAAEVAQAEKAITEARFHLQGKKEELAVRHRDLSKQLEDQKFQAKIQADKANEAYQARARQMKESLKAENLNHLVPKVLDAVKALKDKVIAQSAEAYEILGKQKGKVSIRPILDELKKGLESLTLNGETITKASKQAFEGIQEAISLMEKSGDMVTFPEAKHILQLMGEDTTYTAMAGEFSKRVDAIKQQARGAFNAKVKRLVPEYGQHMEKVIANTKLLEELSQKFGSADNVMSRLNGIKSAKGRHIDAELLKKLEVETNQPFEKEIQRYLGASDVLSTPSKLEAMTQKLPEHGPKAKTEAEALRLSDPKVRRKVGERAKASKQQQELDAANEALRDRKDDLFSAEKKLEPYKKVGAGSVQARVKALTGARNHDTKNIFKGVDEASGHNFSGEIKDRAILDQFNKTDTQGSRKTVMGKSIGGGVARLMAAGAGGAAGYAADGKVGAMMGAGIGFGLDKYSGQVIKKLLDGRIGAADATKALSKGLGKYAKTLVRAAQSGPHVLRTTIKELKKQEEFNSLFSSDSGDDEDETTKKAKVRLKALGG